MVTILKINEALHHKYLHVDFVKGDGYFYLIGTNDEWGTRIAALYTSSVAGGCVPRLQAYTVERWVEECEKTINQE